MTRWNPFKLAGHVLCTIGGVEHQMITTARINLTTHSQDNFAVEGYASSNRYFVAVVFKNAPTLTRWAAMALIRTAMNDNQSYSKFRFLRRAMLVDGDTEYPTYTTTFIPMKAPEDANAL
jgi:hypothetical protein